MQLNESSALSLFQALKSRLKLENPSIKDFV